MLAAFVIVAGIGFYYLKNSKKHLELREPLTVITEQVLKGSISLKEEFTGKIRTRESVTLMPEVVGRITYIKEDGSLVKKGEVIVKLDALEAEGKYKIALGRKNKEEQKLKTMESLFKKNYKSKTHLYEQKADYETAVGYLQEAKAYLDKHTIKAPFTGTIGLHTQSIGATVNHYTKLVTITNLKNLQVEFQMPGTTLNAIGGIEKIKDAKILVILEGELLPIPAKFDAYEGVIDAETNAIAIRVSLDNSEMKMAPGQIARVIVTFGSKDDILIISDDALVAEHGRSYVFKVENGIAVQIAVKTGISDGNKIEIIEGLSQGDMVISSGQYKLSDGQSVKIEEENKEAINE